MRGYRPVAVIGPRIHQALNVCRDQFAVAGRAKLHLGLRTGCRTGGAEHITAVHDHLHRAAGFLSEYHGKRLEIDGGFSTDTAANV